MNMFSHASLIITEIMEKSTHPKRGPHLFKLCLFGPQAHNRAKVQHLDDVRQVDVFVQFNDVCDLSHAMIGEHDDVQVIAHVFRLQHEGVRCRLRRSTLPADIITRLRTAFELLHPPSLSLHYLRTCDYCYIGVSEYKDMS